MPNNLDEIREHRDPRVWFKRPRKSTRKQRLYIIVRVFHSTYREIYLSIEEIIPNTCRVNIMSNIDGWKDTVIGNLDGFLNLI